MDAIQIAEKIMKELSDIIEKVEPESLRKLTEMLLKANKVYVAGAGRSALMIRSFGMRLMHLGFHAYVCGEIATPAAEKGDLIIFGSGSGETGSLTIMAQKAKKLGADIAIITFNPDSTIGRLSDCIVEIPIGLVDSIQPKGSSFEQCMLLICDSLFLDLALQKGVVRENQNIDQFISIRHANLE